MLVRCQYCHGTGLAAGAGDSPEPASEPRMPVSQSVPKQAEELTASEAELPAGSAGVESHQVQCPGCLGSGYVDMPCYA